MELWGPPQHNMVRDHRYGPLETEKSRFGTISGPLDKKFFFFQGYVKWHVPSFRNLLMFSRSDRRNVASHKKIILNPEKSVYTLYFLHKTTH